MNSVFKRLITIDPIFDTVSKNEKVFIIDGRSYSIPPLNPRPSLSVYSDDMSIMTCLVRKVSEEIKV